MQRIRGVSLKDLIAEQRPLPVGSVAAIGAQICAVLVVEALTEQRCSRGRPRTH
jgi:hypothetical protein